MSAAGASLDPYGGALYAVANDQPRLGDEVSVSAGSWRDRTSPDAPAGAGDVVVEREPAAADTDDLTKQTVAKMCEYIGEGIADSDLQRATDLAIERFGNGRRDPFSVAWSVFWFMKHRVKRVLDEGALFRLGEPDQVDMLIAPSVLLRMKDAAEDCDGFTMLAAAMLGAAGVDQCIVTVACDPRDRRRWSHVFGMVRLSNGEWLPLDCSHGGAPGWMVPQHRIYRWQAWGLDGEPLDVAPPVRSNLRGYVYTGPRPRAGYAYPRRFGFGGLGQCTVDDEGNVSCPDDGTTTVTTPTTTVSTPAGCPSLEQLMGITDCGDPCQTSSAACGGSASSAGASPSSPGFNWNSFLASLTGSAAKVATVAEGGTVLPNGTILGAGQSIAGLNLGSLLLFGGLILGGVLILEALEGGHK